MGTLVTVLVIVDCGEVKRITVKELGKIGIIDIPLSLIPHREYNMRELSTMLAKALLRYADYNIVLNVDEKRQVKMLDVLYVDVETKRVTTVTYTFDEWDKFVEQVKDEISGSIRIVEL